MVASLRISFPSLEGSSSVLLSNENCGKETQEQLLPFQFVYTEKVLIL